MSVASKVASIRGARGLTQKALSDKSGVSLVTISRVENGRHQPERETLERLAEALEASLSDLDPGFSSPIQTESSGLMEMLKRQQDLLAEQQGMLSRQQSDVSRLTELLAKQQDFQHRYATEQMERLNSEIRALRSELEQYRGKGGLVEEFSERLRSAQIQVAAEQGRQVGEKTMAAEK